MGSTSCIDASANISPFFVPGASLHWILGILCSLSWHGQPPDGTPLPPQSLAAFQGAAAGLSSGLLGQQDTAATPPTASCVIVLGVGWLPALPAPAQPHGSPINPDREGPSLPAAEVTRSTRCLGLEVSIPRGLRILSFPPHPTLSTSEFGCLQG